MKVFVVEDDVMILLSTEIMLEELGCQVVGTAMGLDEALSKCSFVECDVALLDVNIRGDRSFPVADILATRRVPFVFATGYGRDSIPVQYREIPFVNKPYSLSELRHALASALEPRRRS